MEKKENKEINTAIDLLSDDDFVINQDGKEVKYKILFTYENEQRNATYVFLYLPNDPDDIYVFRYNQNGEVFVIENEEELKEAEEVLEAYNNDIANNENF